VHMIDFEELKATTMSIILKKKARGPEGTAQWRNCISGRWWGKHVVNMIDFEELKVTGMETILKKKARGPEVNGTVENLQAEEEELDVTSGIVNI
jgi:hypothetical protein